MPASNTLMLFTPEQVQKRNSFVQQYRNVHGEMRTIEGRIEELLKDPDSNVEMLEKQFDLLHRQLEPVICEYWHWLPEILLGHCPICQEALNIKFDPVDLHGFWWMDRTQRNAQDPETCPHFCLLTGAMDLCGKPHGNTLFPVETGPEQPFVIPGFLELPGITAVTTSIEMNCGFIAHPVIYFSEHPPQVSPSRLAWGKEGYKIFANEDEPGWTVNQEDFDFNLEPWLESGKLIREQLSE